MLWLRKGDQQKPSYLSFERTHQEVPSSWDQLAFETTSFVFPSRCATTVSRRRSRREIVHVTFASSVELLAWTHSRSSLFPLPVYSNGDSLKIAGPFAFIDVLSVIAANLDGPTAI